MKLDINYEINGKLTRMSNTKLEPERVLVSCAKYNSSGRCVFSLLLCNFRFSLYFATNMDISEESHRISSTFRLLLCLLAVAVMSSIDTSSIHQMLLALIDPLLTSLRSLKITFSNRVQPCEIVFRLPTEC